MTTPAHKYRRVEPGEPAPRFLLPAYPAGSGGVPGAWGRNTILVFYARDFHGRTLESEADLTTQSVSLLSLSCELEWFARANASVLGVSRESLARHALLASWLGIRFPLLCDEAGDVGVEYGVLPENRWAGSGDAYDVSCRVFVIDRSGTVRYRYEPDIVICEQHHPPPTLKAEIDSRLAGFVGTPTVLRTSTLRRALQAIA